MRHGSHGSWVKSSMGHLGHGSLWVTHSLLCASPSWCASVATTTSADLAVTAFDCVRGTGPAYCQQVCLPVDDVTDLSHLRSTERAICWFLGPEFSLTDGVSTLQLQSSGTRFALPPLVVDNSEMGLRQAHLFLQAYTWSPENFSFKSVFIYLLTYLKRSAPMSSTVYRCWKRTDTFTCRYSFSWSLAVK